MQDKVISIFGGTGFLGSYIVKALLSDGFNVRVLCRNTSKATHLKLNAKLGQLDIRYVNISDINSISDGISGSYAVINCIGNKSYSKKNLFLTNVYFPKTLARCTHQQKIPALIHFSTIGVESTYESNYAHSKYEGDQYIQQEKKDAIILRPGLVFGQNDHFIYKLYFLMSRIPVFISNNLKKTISPVHARDIANLVTYILKNNEEYKGNTFNLIGTKEYSLEKIIVALEQSVGKKINIITLKKFLYNLYLNFLPRIIPNSVMNKEYTHLLLYNYNRTPKNLLKQIQIESTDLENFILSGLEEKR